MDTKTFAIPQSGARDIVYVRAVDVADLPQELAAQVDPGRPVYAIHSKDGECLALARDRHVAFAVARTNKMAPVSVH